MLLLDLNILLLLFVHIWYTTSTTTTIAKYIFYKRHNTELWVSRFLTSFYVCLPMGPFLEWNENDENEITVYLLVARTVRVKKNTPKNFSLMWQIHINTHYSNNNKKTYILSYFIWSLQVLLCVTLSSAYARTRWVIRLRYICVCMFFFVSFSLFIFLSTI